MNYPLDAQAVPRFAGPVTFLRLPQVASWVGLDVALFGVPFDGGTSYRPGARFGPRAVREASSLLRPFHPQLEVDPYRVLNVADIGDLPLNPLRMEDMLETVAGAVAAMTRAGALPVAVGGDHSVSLGLLRGVAAAFGPVGLLQFDSHLDIWDHYFSNRYTHGSFLRRALEEGLVDGSRSLQVGIRGPLFGPEDLEAERNWGLEIIPAAEAVTCSVADLRERIRSRLQGGPVYVTFDIDAVDPAYAPGTGTPEVGGLSSAQALALLQGLGGLELVGLDVVEVAPPYDWGQITALLAARILYEFLSVLARNRLEQVWPGPAR